MGMIERCLEREKAKEDHIWHEMSPSKFFLMPHRMPKPPWSDFFCPKCLNKDVVKALIQAILEAIKGKGSKCTMHFQWPMESYSILIQNYGIFTIPASPRRPSYSKGYDLNARRGYHGGVEGHSTKNCTVFKDKVQSLIDTDPTKFRELVDGRWKR